MSPESFANDLQVVIRRRFTIWRSGHPRFFADHVVGSPFEVPADRRTVCPGLPTLRPSPDTFSKQTVSMA
jgi:hypothetical protein